ncbi:MAG: glycosyltransferase family 39 protein [Chloroflexota bacterium]
MRRVLQSFLPLWCILLLLVLIPPWALGRDIWTDEAFTVSYTRHASLADVLEDVRKNEETPPLSSVLAWLWARVAGASAESIRALSLLYAVLAVGLFTDYAQRALSQTEALIAGGILAASPLLGGYVLEARAYTLTLLLTVCCVVLFERLWGHPGDRIALAGYALAGAALLLTSYLGVALLVAHNMCWAGSALWRRAWRRLLGWLGAQLFIAGVFLWWLPALLGRLQIVLAFTPYKGVTPLNHALAMVGVVMHGRVTSAWVIVWLVVSALIWALIIIAAASELQRRETFVLRVFVLPALVLLVTLVAIEAAASRYLMTLLPGASLAAARGWRALQPERPRLALALICVVLGGMLLYRLPARLSQPPAPAWQPLAAYVAQHVAPGDRLIFQPPYDLRTFEYYYRGPGLPLLGARHYDDFYYADGYSFTDSWTADEALAAAEGARRVWVVQNPGSASPKPALPLLLLDERTFGALALRLYARPAP